MIEKSKNKNIFSLAEANEKDHILETLRDKNRTNLLKLNKEQEEPNETGAKANKSEEIKHER